jgi:hypothetical protein
MIDSLGRAQLGDFGIARLDGSPETRSSVITASVAHAPPEVIAGDRPDEGSDVYSLASTLFELIDGSPAFSAETDESIIPMFARIAQSPVPDLRGRGVPPELAAELERAMSKDRTQRHSGAEAFGRALIDVQQRLGQAPTRLWIWGDDASAAPEQLTQTVAPPAQSPVPGVDHTPQWTQPGSTLGPTPIQPGHPGQVSGPSPVTGPNPAPPGGPAPSPAYAGSGQQSPPAHQAAAYGYQGSPPGGAPGGYDSGQFAAQPPASTGGSSNGINPMVILAVVGGLIVVAGLAVIGLLANNDDAREEIATDLIDSERSEIDPLSGSAGSDSGDGDADASADTGDSDSTTSESTGTTETTVPEETTTTTTEPVLYRPEYLNDLPPLTQDLAPYAGFRTVVDDNGAFSFQVPSEWVDTETGPGEAFASPDNDSVDPTPGVIINGLQGFGVFDADFFLDGVLANIEREGTCSELYRTPYDDGVFTGSAMVQTCDDSVGFHEFYLVTTDPDLASVIFIFANLEDERDVQAVEKIIDTFLLADPSLLPSSD